MSGTQKIRKRISSMILLLCLLAVCILPTRAYAAENPGVITVKFPVTGVNYSLYCIGTPGESGSGYELNETYAAYSTEQNSKEFASTLSTYVTRDQIAAQQTVQTDENGEAKFENLEKGVYLIIGDQAVTEDGTYISSPVVISVPAQQDGQESWNILVDKKYELKPTGSATTRLTVQKIWKNDSESTRPESITVQLLKDGKLAEGITDEDGKNVTEVVLSGDNNWTYTWEDLDSTAVWTATEKTVPDGYTLILEKDKNTIVLTNTATTPTTPDTPSSDKKLPKTGQLWWPVFVMIAGGLFCILVGLLVRRRD